MNAVILAALLAPRPWRPSGRTLGALNAETELARHLEYLRIERRAQRLLN